MPFDQVPLTYGNATELLSSTQATVYRRAAVVLLLDDSEQTSAIVHVREHDSKDAEQHTYSQTTAIIGRPEEC